MSQAYRDLVWALTSPPLMAKANGWQLAHIPSHLELEGWLETINNNPSLLESFLKDAQANRLGIYYEFLLKFFFEYHPDYQLLMHNHPVFQEKRTMGAFDFIYKNKENQTIHRECAVKFYLGVPKGHENPSAWNNWWGPNKVDRLDIKLRRLMEHQIPLSDTPQALEMLAQENIHIDKKEIDLKGYLCYPLNSDMPAPTDINPNHLRATWLDYNTIDALPKRCYWDILPRLRWLSPVAFPEKPELTTSKLVKTLDQHFKKMHAPLLIVRLKKVLKQYIEQERFFITPSDWQTLEVNDE
jgi:uncharacterized protein